MNLTDLAAKVLAKLEDEVGTQEFWNETDIIADANWLYRDLSRSLGCLRKRDISTLTVVSTARYAIPKPTGVDSILRVLGVSYDKEPLDYYTTSELDAMDYRWRSLGDGTPYGCYFELGDENLYISLVPPPSAAKELGFDLVTYPTALTASETPLYPFDDGDILYCGLMSMQLSKDGGGRDLDRADWWFGQMMSTIPQLVKHKGFSWRGFRSIEEVSHLSTKGIRLPSNYPKYSFDD